MMAKLYRQLSSPASRCTLEQHCTKQPRLPVVKSIERGDCCRVCARAERDVWKGICAGIATVSILLLPLPSEANMQMLSTPAERSRTSSSASTTTSGKSANSGAAALRILRSAEDAVDRGSFQEALDSYTFITQNYGDLALAEYARIGRALLLFQVGNVSDALLLMEDEEVALRGAAQVHAALAAMLYTERPALILKAEQEWDVSQEFDKRYSDIEWVKVNKHWPPRVLQSLQKFLQLQ